MFVNIYYYVLVIFYWGVGKKFGKWKYVYFYFGRDLGICKYIDILKWNKLGFECV